MSISNDYLITEKPLRALIRFCAPMIAGNLFQQAYTIVDSAIVGHYNGETALAAVGASYSLTTIFICVAIGGGIGASVIISHHFGARRYGQMRSAVSTAMLTFLGISVLLSAVGLLFSILFPILFLVVLGMILYTIIGNISTWNKNNHSPRLTVPATVVAKRTEVSRHHTDNTMMHTFTTYYAAFQVESGDRMELTVSGSDYGMLVEGDIGKLSFQGTRYLGFERN